MDYRVVTPDSMRKLERYAMDELHIDELTLMENAAHGLACEIIAEINSGKDDVVNVTLISGTGNNGGDVLAATRILLTGSHGLIANKKFGLSLCLVGDKDKMSSASAQNIDRLRETTLDFNGDIPFAFKIFNDLSVDEYDSMLLSSNIIVDGLFGIGLSRPAIGLHKAAIDGINRAKLIDDSIRVIAVDIPSGIEAKSGVALDSAVKADLTVTMQAVKTGMLMNDGVDLVGDIKIVSIFTPFGECQENEIDIMTRFCDIETEHDTSDLYNKYLNRKKNTNKGSFGKVLCICGSDEMRGAAIFAAKAAFAIGSGLVYVATTRSVWDSCSVVCPEAVGVILNENSVGGIDGFDLSNLDRIRQKLMDVDAVLVGPGMMNDLDGNTRNIVQFVLNNAEIPVIIDADGLNSIAGYDMYSERKCPALVVTPHPGEMSRMMQCSIAEIQSDRVGVVRDFINKTEAITLLKGCGTIVGHDEKMYINTTGGAALSVAGSGDLLAGMMVGLIAQYSKLAAKVYNEKEARQELREITYCAVKTAAYLHGLIGDEAEKDSAIGNITAVPLKILEKLGFVLERERECLK